jgi:hypothetical protein
MARKNPEKHPVLEKKLIGATNNVQIQSIESRIVLATLEPGVGTAPTPVVVSPGFGFAFTRAVNNGWTDNRDNGSNPPLQGWEFDHSGQYLYNALRAQLVALSGSTYVAYDLDVDWSQGGNRYYPNQGQTNWTLYWYMNDALGHYRDNNGTANFDITVFKI